WLSVNFDFFIASTLKLVFLSTFKHYGFKGSLQFLAAVGFTLLSFTRRPLLDDPNERKFPKKSAI
ncbi:hypothetical protein, partial [Taibaiella chishuiensis]|uniref:hypothetical protein n=1 Tax=Taibaiella chishuiensis TaxID=1434707 RepID=UPI001C636621